MPILNKNIVHLVDNMFWNMGFKTQIQADKVISVIHIILIIRLCCYAYYTDYTDYINYFQVCVELGIADHIWLDKRKAIAQTVDALGDEFKPAMRAGWMSYISKVYPDGPADGGHVIGQEPLILDE